MILWEKMDHFWCWNGIKILLKIKRFELARGQKIIFIYLFIYFFFL